MFFLNRNSLERKNTPQGENTKKTPAFLSFSFWPYNTQTHTV